MIFSNRGESDQVVVNPGNDTNVEKPNEEDNQNQPQPPVTVEEELIKPFTINAKVERYFFDVADSVEIQELSILEYKGKYTPSYAMEYTYNNTKFDVIAAFDGIVTERKVDPLYGYMVYIKNDKGLTAVYGSLTDITVNVGDSVKQGDVIAKAGSNTIDAGLNNHLHFALMKNGKTINPNKHYGQKIKDIV